MVGCKGKGKPLKNSILFFIFFSDSFVGALVAYLNQPLSP